MGKRGPKRTPTNVLKARGSWLADTRTDEPKPPTGPAECPAWVLGDAREHWAAIEPMLTGMGVMSPAYSSGLALLVNSLGRYIEFERQLTESGGAVLFNDRGNAMTNPALTARNKAWDQCLKVLREFGLTPSAVTEIKPASNGDDDEQDDSMDAVLRLA